MPPSAQSSAKTRVSTARLPQRYEIREGDDGRYLACLDSQNLVVRIEPGKTTTAAAARRAAEGTIFLDGAAQGEPFMAVGQRVYNLDHHEGCVRAFTLATCEQAMVLVGRGLDLRAGTWTIRAGEPDLDTVLAIWTLLNHTALQQPDSRVRAAIMPVLRLEGTIDAHGLGLIDLCGFSPELLAATRRTLDGLRTRELELKKQGSWSSSDPLEYVVRVLHAVDRLVYEPDQLRDYTAIEELGRVPIGNDRIAILCRAQSGIYEVEEALREQHRDRLGLIVLQKDVSTYTLRQVDAFLPIGLDELYARLNLVDNVVRKANRWGGSAEIGGSPRTTGTELSVQDISDVIATVFRPGSAVRGAGALIATGAVTAIAAAAALAVAALGGWRWTGGTSTLGGLFGQSWYAGAMAGAAALLYGLHAWRGRRRYGAELPSHHGWLLLAPIALVLGAVGGSWLPPALAGEGGAALAVGLPLALAAELVFRGAIYGRLASAFATPPGWRITLSAGLSAGLSAALSIALFAPALAALGGWAAAWRIALLVLGSVGAGLLFAVARQRSESVLPPVVLHALAATAAAYVSVLGA